jgi:hypothetical protein
MAKKVKIKLPKRVAGLKIPKVVRKGPIGEFLNSGAGQTLLAETLVAAAAVFTAAKTDEDSPVAEGLRHPVEGARRVSHAVSDAGSDQTARLAYAFKEASRAFREALQNGNAAAWEERPETLSEEAGAKKKSSARTTSGTSH